jgi:hypothetical protein
MRRFAMLLVLSLVMLVQCVSHDQVAATAPPVAPATGRFALALVDAPGDAKQVWITVEEIRLRLQGGCDPDQATILTSLRCFAA